METKITLDRLNARQVSVITRNILVVDGTEYEVGLPHRRAFVNNTAGREEICNYLVEPYLSAVMALWGDEPTVPDHGGEV